ncbi:MAG TPA: hypothetical protein P5056_02195 [Candidatus Paceibacterota bacterium]|nr:hypothetical protein [Candidatus Paceibacterota bacterium]
MKGKCDKCAEKPPMYLDKGKGVPGTEPCKWCERMVAPRASNKPMRSKKK